MNIGRIGFIGAGNIAGAIIRGLIGGKIVNGNNIMVINKSNQNRLQSLQAKFGVEKAKDIGEIAGCSVIVLAVKPKDMGEVLTRLAGAPHENPLVISVAAGIPIHFIEEKLGGRIPVIRAMPNTPSQVGEGVTALTAGNWVTEENRQKAEAVFQAVGKTVWVQEEDLDAVTALSGSGPAYFYQLVEDMTEAGERLGLDRELAERLAAQTLIGAGKALAESEEKVAVLKKRIISPNGTTAAALLVWQKEGVGTGIRKAMEAAARRSEEMSREYTGGEGSYREQLAGAKRIVVKVGSSTITRRDGSLDEGRLARLTEQIARLHNDGREVILVSSGAVAAGRGKLKTAAQATLGEKQALAAIGQGLLMKAYETLFEIHGIPVAQVLLTREDLGSPKRSTLFTNTLNQLLQWGTVPVINENDTVAVDEIKFGDNDTLSARVAAAAGADLLVLLTDIDGFYTADPRKVKEARLLSTVNHIAPEFLRMAQGTGSSVGTGGMVTKIWAANLAMEHGIPTVIANGSLDNVLQDILSGKDIGTLFIRQKATEQGGTSW